MELFTIRNSLGSHLPCPFEFRHFLVYRYQFVISCYKVLNYASLKHFFSQSVNHHSVPQGWFRTTDTYSDSSQPGSVQSRSSYETRSRVEPENRRLHHTPSHQRGQTSTDRQASSKTSLQRGAGREESGPSYRRSHKGSVFSGLVLASLTYPP